MPKLVYLLAALALTGLRAEESSRDTRCWRAGTPETVRPAGRGARWRRKGQ